MGAVIHEVSESSGSGEVNDVTLKKATGAANDRANEGVCESSLNSFFKKLFRVENHILGLA